MSLKYGKLRAVLLEYLADKIGKTFTATQIWEGIDKKCDRTAINTALKRLKRDGLIDYTLTKMKDPKTGYYKGFLTIDKVTSLSDVIEDGKKREPTPHENWQNLWKAIRKGETHSKYKQYEKKKKIKDERSQYGWYSRMKNTFED